jgi:hypothetical protein
VANHRRRRSADGWPPLRARHVRSIWRIIAGYTIGCRNGLIAAM